MPDPRTPLRDAVALVTGASRGIGRATAIELGAAGATVYLTARSLDAPSGPTPGTARETAEAVTAAGGHGIALRCDHADDEQVQAVVDRIAADHHGLDLLVNNAFPGADAATNVGPRWGGAPFWETTADTWHVFFTVAVRGHYVATQKAMPLLLERAGLVVGVSSCGAASYFMNPLYGAGKAAGDRLMRDMALELRDHPVSIMSVWPGIVRTELTSGIYEQAPDALRLLLRDGWAAAPTAEQDLAALDSQDLLDLCESPTFTGRAIAALAGDPDLSTKHGQALPVVLLADEYGFTDIDGRRPDAFRFRDASAWPQFAAPSPTGS